jgi:hypothetical protein
MMRLIQRSVVLLLLVICISCQKSREFDAEKYLNGVEQQVFLYKIGRYVAKLPKNVDHEQKFSGRFDSYYKEEMAKYTVLSYFIDGDSTHYFLIDRPAPSLYGKRAAIGGKLRYDKEGGIQEYEEVFHTWKMKEEELLKKGEVLFAAMVDGKSLEAYLPGKSAGKWIEFPDAQNYFDKEAKRWKIREQNTTVFTVR